MSDLKQRLTTGLLRMGQQRLADIWKCDPSEAGRRMNGQRNIPLDDLCTALEAMGIDIVTPDQNAVTVPKDEWLALRTLARKSLESE